MKPSFDPKFVDSKAREDFILAELRRGRVAAYTTSESDNAWVWETTVTTRWTADGGFRRDSRTYSGVGMPGGRIDPSLDRAEENVPESAIRRDIRRHGMYVVITESILEDLAEADARGDRAAARAHAARLIGPSATNQDAPIDEVLRSFEAGDHDEARALADRVFEYMSRPGVTVFGLLMQRFSDETEPDFAAMLHRTEARLRALVALYPDRGELSYWHAAALELQRRRPEARAAYARARALGKLKDYHSDTNPAARDPKVGRRALQALQKHWVAKRASR
jgi:hypothetical protein